MIAVYFICLRNTCCLDSMIRLPVYIYYSRCLFRSQPATVVKYRRSGLTGFLPSITSSLGVRPMAGGLVGARYGRQWPDLESSRTRTETEVSPPEPPIE